MDVLDQQESSTMSDSSDTDDFLQELAALNDAGLLRATVESLELGRLTPLIKEELRCRIQSRRLSEGKEELLVDFPSPTHAQPRPDEVEKRDRRREQNRRAAQKFRKKKKERGDHLIEESQRLESHNTTLRSEIKQLHEEREQLTRIIQSHASICPLTPRQSPLTLVTESPTPHNIRDSPFAPPPGTLTSPRPILVQSPALLVPPTRESPVPLLIIQPSSRESPCHVISPRPPRKSPVAMLAPSPVPVDKSHASQTASKHSKCSTLPKLAKSVVPILPKPISSPKTPRNLIPSPLPKPVTSPKTPRGILTSPLPLAPSPVSVTGRAIHQSPVFFSEGCFSPSPRIHAANPSPVSFTESGARSAHTVSQSPVFFSENLPGVTGKSHSKSSSSLSSSSIVSILRQESPSSLHSTSSISSTGSGFLGTGSNFTNVVSTNNGGTDNSNTNTLTNAVTSCSNQGGSVLSMTSAFLQSSGNALSNVHENCIILSADSMKDNNTGNITSTTINNNPNNNSNTIMNAGNICNVSEGCTNNSVGHNTSGIFGTGNSNFSSVSNNFIIAGNNTFNAATSLNNIININNSGINSNNNGNNGGVNTTNPNNTISSNSIFLGSGSLFSGVGNHITGDLNTNVNTSTFNTLFNNNTQNDILSGKDGITIPTSCSDIGSLSQTASVWDSGPFNSVKETQPSKNIDHRPTMENQQSYTMKNNGKHSNNDLFEGANKTPLDSTIATFMEATSSQLSQKRQKTQSNTENNGFRRPTALKDNSPQLRQMLSRALPPTFNHRPITPTSPIEGNNANIISLNNGSNITIGGTSIQNTINSSSTSINCSNPSTVSNFSGQHTFLPPPSYTQAIASGNNFQQIQQALDQRCQISDQGQNLLSNQLSQQRLNNLLSGQQNLDLQRPPPIQTPQLAQSPLVRQAMNQIQTLLPGQRIHPPPPAELTNALIDEDNALSLEEIERSAEVCEPRADLLDLMDISIQSLLELSADNSNTESSSLPEPSIDSSNCSNSLLMTAAGLSGSSMPCTTEAVTTSTDAHVSCHSDHNFLGLDSAIDMLASPRSLCGLGQNVFPRALDQH